VERVGASVFRDDSAALLLPSAGTNEERASTRAYRFGDVERKQHPLRDVPIPRTEPGQRDQAASVIRADTDDAPSLASNPKGVAD
jgi:hypothetical protein